VFPRLDKFLGFPIIGDGSPQGGGLLGRDCTVDARIRATLSGMEYLCSGRGMALDTPICR
jgi:hypothetical protein